MYNASSVDWATHIQAITWLLVFVISELINGRLVLPFRPSNSRIVGLVVSIALWLVYSPAGFRRFDIRVVPAVL